MASCKRAFASGLHFGYALTALLLIASCGTVAPATQSGQEASSGHVAPGPSVQSAGLAPDGTGWVLTMDRLQISSGGRSWRTLTVPGVTVPNVRAAFLLNAERIWVIAMPPPAGPGTVSAGVYVSADGGARWRTGQLHLVVSARGIGDFFLTFEDQLHGWLSVDEGSHAGFSYGSLYRTTDGGLSWSQLVAPQSSPVTFANAEDGISSGGPAALGTFVTHDGGATWRKITLPSLPAGDLTAVLGTPTFVSGTAGVLPANLLGSDHQPTAVGFFTTSDSGRSWTLTARVPNARPDLGLVHSVYAIDLDHWIIPTFARGSGAPAETQYVNISADRGRSWANGGALPGSIDSIFFANATFGWAIISENGCNALKSDCYSNSGLFETMDGGRSWSQLTI
jgi:photosystem II stability/assembly factor-like uncharacterized protein